MDIKNVSIIGLGALGILFGQQMAEKPGSKLTIIADEGRIEKYQKQGIFCNGKPCDFHYQTPDDHGIADLILFSVKISGLNDAIRSVKSHVGPDTILMSLLNGITSEAIIGAAFGEANLIWAVAQGMDAVKEANRLQYRNPGMICFGNRNGDEPSEKVARVQRFFNRASPIRSTTGWTGKSGPSSC